MAITPYSINSCRLWGLEPFTLEPETVYVHMAEMTILSNQKLTVPVGGNSPYLDGCPEWVERIVAEGPAWYPGELKVLNHLLGLIAEFSDEADCAEIRDRLLAGSPRLVPFAYPVVMQCRDGRRQPALGLVAQDNSKIFLLRHMLFNDPLGLLMVAYHEGVHAVHGGDEMLAHTLQLNLCQKASRWMKNRSVLPEDEPGKKQLEALLLRMEGNLQRRIEELRS